MKRAGFNERVRSSRGFTLIEIMVVVGILGIVLAMGVPPFVRIMQKDSLTRAVNDITEACAKARAEAILQGVPAELVIRSDGRLSVGPAREAERGRDAAGGEPAPRTVDTGYAKAGFSAHFGEDVAITLLYVNLKDQMKADESRVHFYPNGTSDEFTIVLETARGVRKVSLECVTGLANVEVLR